MTTQLTRKYIALVGIILVILLGAIVTQQYVSLAQTLTRNSSQISTQDFHLTNVRPWYNSPLWSPDGLWMAWSSFTEGLYTQKIDGSAERKKLGSAGVHRREIAWSWDSEVLFYQVNQPVEYPPFTERWIESVNIVTGEVTKHPELSIFDDLDSVAKARYPSDPILSLNFEENVIEARTKDGTRHWRVTPHPVRHLSTVLSPDKKKVLASGYVYATDGSGHLADLGEGLFGSWSPDGTKIIYAIQEDDGHAITASDLYVIGADGTGKKQLTDTRDELEYDPHLLSDGKRVVFSSSTLESDSSKEHLSALYTAKKSAHVSAFHTDGMAILIKGLHTNSFPTYIADIVADVE